jgi:predicted ATPase/transcriptional regulator with XRE-family HTH domain
MAFEVSFGAWVARRRKALDLTRDQLARRVGCSASALRKIESDERRPSRQMAERLAECLQVLPDQRLTFLQVARGVLRVERLGTPLPASAPTEPRLTPPHSPSNLPTPLTPLIGREPELAMLAQLLHDPRCRLLTLVGPGGIGKTRLAIEVACAQRAAFADGVFFVSLASTGSTEFILPAIAAAMGFTFSGPTEPRVQLMNYLCGKHILLLLDNLEHLLDGVELFTRILECAPESKLLVTSRERLDLHGEWVFEVQGLPAPADDQVEGLESYSAVALFLHSARRAWTSFQLTPQDRPHVARICRLVEGMPLGIELAAVWVSMLTCQEIAKEIERNLDFLTTSVRDAPARHQSLRAVFDHSWNLLAADERDVLCRLAVFQGGFERGAAEQVAGASLPSLLTLVSKSLVRYRENGRYDLHQVVRQYALAHLDDDPQNETVRDRHSDFYLALLRDREKLLKSAAQREAIQELTDEIDNVRAAWAWAVRREKFGSIAQATRSFGWLFEVRGWLREGIEQLELVVQAMRARPEDAEQSSVLGEALTQQGLLYFRWGRFDRALTLLHESLNLLRPLGDPALLSHPLVYSGVITFLNGELEQAQSLLEEGLACARAANDQWIAAYASFNLGYIASLSGRYTEGHEQMSDGLALWRTIGDLRSIALGLNYLSPTAIKLGRYEEARAYLQESLTLCAQVGDRWGTGTAYRHLGLAALAQGHVSEAQALLHKSLEVFDEFVTGWDIVQSLVYLGEAATADGDSPQARQIFLQAFQMALGAQSLPLALDALMGLALLHAQAGETRPALEFSLCVLHHPASPYEARARARRLCAQLETQLSPQQLEAVRARPFQVLAKEILKTPAHHHGRGT